MLNDVTQTLGFEEVSAHLVNVEIGPQASELHGAIAGLVCAGADLDGKVWIDRIIAHMNPDDWDEGPNLLLRLYGQVSHQFNGIEFTFQMLLPDNSHPLPVRMLALTQWCRGFMWGLQTAEHDLSKILTEELKENLNQLNELSSLDREEIETREETAFTFDNAAEFIRKSVWALYTARVYSFSMKQRIPPKKALH